MQCEICGTEIFGLPNKIITEGSELTVCDNCVRYGDLVSRRRPPDQKRVIGSIISRGRRSGIPEPKYILVSNYGKVIKDAREKRDLTQEKLAAVLNEKASLIGKIEREDISPDEDTTRKIEHALGIKLFEKVEASGEAIWTSSKKSKTLTLGDIVTVKRRK